MRRAFSLSLTHTTLSLSLCTALHHQPSRFVSLSLSLCLSLPLYSTPVSRTPPSTTQGEVPCGCARVPTPSDDGSDGSEARRRFNVDFVLMNAGKWRHLFGDRLEVRVWKPSPPMQCIDQCT